MDLDLNAEHPSLLASRLERAAGQLKERAENLDWLGERERALAVLRASWEIGMAASRIADLALEHDQGRPLPQLPPRITGRRLPIDTESLPELCGSLQLASMHYLDLANFYAVRDFSAGSWPETYRQLKESTERLRWILKEQMYRAAG